MQYTTVALAAFSALLSSAAAVPTNKARQSCFLAMPDETNFVASLDIESGVARSTILDFEIGEVATGPCSLVARFQPGWTSFTQSGNTQLNVYGFSENAPGALVGTVTLDPVNGQDITINSFQCENSPSFQFEIANPSQDGEITFTADDMNGIFLKVGDGSC